MLWMMAAAMAGSPSGHGDLCRELRQASPRVEVVRTALDAGVDPNEACHWSNRVPLYETVPGVIGTVLLPGVGVALGVTTWEDQTHEARPLDLAVRTGDDTLVEMLLRYRAEPHPSDVADALERGDHAVLGRLIEAGAPAAVITLPYPVATNPERLQQALEVGIRLDEVRFLAESRPLRTDPDFAVHYLDAGLPPERLLIEAVHAGGSDVVELCLERIDPASRTATRALSEAVEDRNWALVDRILAAGVPIEPVESGRCVICETARQGSVSATRELLARGASPHGDERHDPPVEEAAEDGRTELVQLLLDAGARPEDALTGALSGHHWELIDTLLEAGADPQRVLPLAVGDGHWQRVDRLTAVGARLDHPRVLSAAIHSDQPDTVQGMLDRGVSPNARIGDSSWVVIAVSNERLDRVEELVRAGAPIDGLTTETSPLQAAIQTGDTGVVRAVLDLGADPKALPDPDAAWRTHPRDELHPMLLNIGVPPGSSQFLDAVEDDDLERVQRYLDIGADPNGAFSSTWHPLIRARSRAMEELLMDAGATPPGDWLDDLWEAGDLERLERVFAQTAVDAGSLPADVIDDAVDAGELDPVRWLLEHGASPRSSRADPLLRTALDNGDEAMAILLLEAGANASTPSYGQRYATLAIAYDNGLENLTPQLVEAGADLEPEEVWRTPEEAAHHAGPEAVRALLDAGHPVTSPLVDTQARACDLEGLMAHRSRWPDDLRRGPIRRAGRRAGCARAVRKIVRRPR